MTEYQQLRDEMVSLNAQIIQLCGRTARAPLEARRDGIKAQLKAYTIYQISGYGRGSTNGQRPLAHCIVATKGDKNDAIRAGLSQLRTYKVLAYRLPRLTDVTMRAGETARLYNHECPIIDA